MTGDGPVPCAVRVELANAARARLLCHQPMSGDSPRFKDDFITIIKGNSKDLQRFAAFENAAPPIRRILR